MLNDPYSTTKPTHTQIKSGTHEQPCPCGCAPCEEPCCALECAEQPHFFCGQLLGNDDLNAIVQWSQARLRRRRYLHGWGVVCGLNVRCDPDNHTGVILSEGYAVDCCGEDIVVCDDVALDLARYCADESCLDPWREQRALANTSAEEEQPNNEETGCNDLPDVLANAAAFDLYLYYHEKGSHPETSLGGCNCGQGTHCEFSRMQETFRWEMKPVSPGRQDPRKEAYHAWWSAYNHQLGDFMTLIDRLLDTVGDKNYREQEKRQTELVEALCRKLKGWLKRHPLQHFCFVDELIASCEEKLLDEGYLARLLFWMLLDYRLSLLHCDCPRCDPQSGVPVARVWLQIPDYRQKRKCRVLLVMDWQPYRRPLQQDMCLPACPDQVNMERYVGKREDEIETKDRFDIKEFRCPTNLENLRKWFQKYTSDRYGPCVDLSTNDKQPLYYVNGIGNNGRFIVGHIGHEPEQES